MTNKHSDPRNNSMDKDIDKMTMIINNPNTVKIVDKAMDINNNTHLTKMMGYLDKEFNQETIVALQLVILQLDFMLLLEGKAVFSYSEMLNLM